MYESFKKAELVVRTILEKRWEDGDAVRVNCSLIPLNQALIFIAFLSALNFLTWIFCSWASNPFLVSVSVLLQTVLISMIILLGVRLSIKLSPAGIEATSALHKQSLFSRTRRTWNDLHSVRLRRMSSSKELLSRLKESRFADNSVPSLWKKLQRWMGKGWLLQGFLIIDFKSGGLVAFPLAGFSAQALEDLFLMLSRYADPMALNPDVIALQRDILTGQELQLNDSYTRMWEETLRQRFEVTNFVPLLGGQVLRGGDLKILMLLCCGGMSSVYLARNQYGERIVLKEMAVPEGSDDAVLTRVHDMFSREAAILAKLRHPNIVKVLDHFVEDARDYLVLEFVPGLTLRQHVQMHGPIPEEHVLRIARQLAEILSYLHGFNPPIIHRDLTPDNLVAREPDNAVILIDFGAAHEFVSRVTGTMIGKQCYIPPEQFRGQSVPQSDLYALGATLSFLLTGEDPEPITTSHPRLLNERISTETDLLVSRLTATEVESRVQTAEELLTLLSE